MEKSIGQTLCILTATNMLETHKNLARRKKMRKGALRWLTATQQLLKSAARSNTKRSAFPVTQTSVIFHIRKGKTDFCIYIKGRRPEQSSQKNVHHTDLCHRSMTTLVFQWEIQSIPEMPSVVSHPHTSSLSLSH